MSIGKDVTNKRKSTFKPEKESEDTWEERERRSADKQDEKLPEETAKFPKKLKGEVPADLPKEQETFPFEKPAVKHVDVDVHLHTRRKRKTK